jgi:3-oxoacyl-[acyl-carrier protein] reductase
MEYTDKDFKPEDISASLPASLSLVGKNAIVTGSSRGIGAQIAIALAERGANVALNYTSESSKAKAEDIASKIKLLGRKTCVIHCDLEDADCGKTIVSQALEGLETKTLHILVNNAALSGMGKAEDGIDLAYFDRVMRVNTRAPAQMLAATLPHFDTTIAGNPNRVINISSIAGRICIPGAALYAASKAAMDALTRTWAKEIGRKYKCTVNGVLVGPTTTPDAPLSEARKAAMRLITAEERFGSMNDVSDVVCWLASDASRW